MLLACALARPAHAQALADSPSVVQAMTRGTTVCGLPVPPPSKDPPEGSGPIVLAMLLCFEKQGGASMIEPETYLYYIQV